MKQDKSIAAGEAARRLGVSPATIQRWVDTGLLSANLTAGGHRRISLAQVSRLAHTLRPATNPDELSRWITIALRGDALELRNAFLQVRAAYGNWAQSADALTEFLVELGSMWETGGCSVYEEHVASEAFRRAAASCSADIQVPESAPVVILLSVAGERHVLGLSLGELVLREYGWRTVWVGEGPPSAELLPMVHSIRPKVLAVSGTAALSGKIVNEYEAALQNAAVCENVTVIVGGSARWLRTPSQNRIQTFRELAMFLAQVRLGP